MRDVTGPDYIGVSAAVLLAVMPLLPAGPAYVHLPPFSYIEWCGPALLLVWLTLRFKTRGMRPIPSRLPLIAWPITLAIIIGAGIAGVLAENHVDSRVFQSWARQAPADLFRPMNHVTHPLYPLRVALTFVEGWLVFVLLVDLCRRAPDPRARARIVLAGWLVGFGLVSVMAVLQYLTHFGLHPYWLAANPDIVRAHATLDDPNALGAYLTLGIGLACGLLYLGPRRRRVVWAAVLGLGMFALVTTMSRSALGSALVAVVCVLAVGVPRPEGRRRVVRSGARVLLAGLALLVVASMLLRLSTDERRRTQPATEVQLVVKTFDPRESTDWVLRGRVAWWTAAMAMFRDYPLTGIGLGRFPRQMATYGGGPAQENTHNLYLQMFAEAGIVGGVAFLAWCASVALGFVRALNAARAPATRAIALGGLIGSVAFLMTLLTGHTLLLPSGQLLFASFLAVVTILVKAELPTPAPRQVRGRVLVALTVGAALLFPVVARWEGRRPHTDAWGYAHGLYPVEATPEGVPYRWTSARATLDLPVPEDAATLQLSVAAPSPVRQGAPTTVRLTVGGFVYERSLASADLETFVVPLPRTVNGRLLIDVVTFPTFVPSRTAATPDDRVLGVQLLRPTFGGRAGG